MAPKPASLPRWADVGGSITEPSAGKKDIGFEVGEKPPAQHFNWLFNLIYQWAAYVDDLANQAMTWTLAHTFQKGVTVTQSTSNSYGLVSTGNGSGAGINATGGATNAPGIFAVGGGTTGIGVRADGGSANGQGANFNGTGTATGVVGTGGSTSGAGVAGTGGAPNGAGGIFTGTGNGRGILANASGSETGVVGNGGATSGAGVAGSGGTPNGIGGTFSGAGVGAGVQGTGGGSGGGINGAGVVGVGGAPNGTGGIFTGTGTGAAVQIGTGNATFTGANPSSSTAFSNKVTPKNIVKAWVLARCTGASSVSIIDGFNVSSVSITAGSPNGIQLTLATAFADTNYSVLASHSNFAFMWISTKTVSTVAVTGMSFSPPSSVARTDFNTTVGDVYIQVMGGQ